MKTLPKTVARSLLLAIALLAFSLLESPLAAPPAAATFAVS